MVEYSETGDGHHISTAIPPYITITVLCLYCNFSTLLYHSAKSKSSVTSNAYREVNLVLSTKPSQCGLPVRTDLEGAGPWQGWSGDHAGARRAGSRVPVPTHHTHRAEIPG